ncbi:MAG TPA: ATPase, T2SS/T4P/T4SS family [Bacteroidota bacterium]|nr:ATPase, T2SS/T4P/T4SS family [Bacteroidota bacterium]
MAVARDEKDIVASRSARKELGDVFVEKGIISADDLLQALEIMGRENYKVRRKLPQVLVQDFKVDRNKVYQEVADYYAFRTIDLNAQPIDDNALAFIRKELNSLPVSLRTLAIENNVLPYSVDAEHPDRLLVVTPDPTNRAAYEVGRAFSYPKHQICYLPFDQWEELWKRVSIDRSTYRDKETVIREDVMADEIGEDAEQYEQALEEEISRSGLVDLVENLFIDAVRVGASDIHIIPRGEKITEFHFRIDGKLTKWYTNMETRAEAVAAVVKDRAKNLDRFERNAAQDGFAQLNIDRRMVRFRVSVIPVVGKELRSKHESIVIRILQEPTVGGRLEDLGFDPYSEQVFRKAISKPHGIVIVTGPTGSGKSTTLVGALRTVMDPSLNVITVEDPVEYFIEGARQTKLNPKLDFDGALRAILRHDPDIVMVGEIRDKSTAEIAVKLANTGHLTLSTLHTNDAASAISRLYKMGIEPFLIAYTINIVLSQRLVRKLCERCKTPYQPDIEALRKLDFPEEKLRSTTFYKPVGCVDCIKGYKGRTAIHEALYFTKEIRKLILQAGDMVDEEAIRQAALRNGMRTLRMNAVELLSRGTTSMEEIISATADDD